MKTDLWVIVIALLIAVGFTAFQFGGLFSRFGALFPITKLLDKVRQEGWDAGFDAGFPHGARADGIDPDEWLPAEPQWQYGPRWDDTVEDLMQRGRSYYEPLARGAGLDPSPVTTAACASADIPLKADSPGPGLPPSLIFDELAATWPAYETPAPISSPLVGAGPEPPAPAAVLPIERHQPGTGDARKRGDVDALDGLNGVRPDESPRPEPIPGPGADPWHQITEANHDVWEVFDDSEVFGMIRWEIAALKRKLSEPWKLTPWKGAPA